MFFNDFFLLVDSRLVLLSKVELHPTDIGTESQVDLRLFMVFFRVFREEVDQEVDIQNLILVRMERLGTLKAYLTFNQPNKSVGNNLVIYHLSVSYVTLCYLFSLSVNKS